MTFILELIDSVVVIKDISCVLKNVKTATLYIVGNLNDPQKSLSLKIATI